MGVLGGGGVGIIGWICGIGWEIGSIILIVGWIFLIIGELF